VTDNRFLDALAGTAVLNGVPVRVEVVMLRRAASATLDGLDGAAAHL
jgi:hypothetical protein